MADSNTVKETKKKEVKTTKVDLTELQRYSPTPRSFMKNMSGEFVMLADVERLLNA